MFIRSSLTPVNDNVQAAQCLVNPTHIVAIRERLVHPEHRGEQYRLLAEITLIGGDTVTVDLGEHESRSRAGQRWEKFCGALEVVDAT